MLDGLKKYFVLVSNYRKATNPLVRKVLLEDSLPELARTTSSAHLRNRIATFIKEVTDGDQGNQRAG